MNTMTCAPLPMNRRILLVDDNAAIHDDFKKILAPTDSCAADVDAEAAALFDQETAPPAGPGFELDSAHQGAEALEMVRAAKAEGRPYALVFMDMRMPPGWDGLTTISRVWEVDREIQTVICTAYSDRSWEEIQATLTSRERWLVLKKPFDKIEVLQLAHALTEKWNFGRLAALKVESLERMVEARTLDLQNVHRVKSEFLANVSHELLTPMNGVCGFLDLVSHSPLNEQQRADIEEARQCAWSLLRLITQVLDFNCLEAGTMAVEPVAFTPADLLHAVVEENTASASTKGIQLRIDATRLTEARWLAPETVIRKALVPLVHNAVKFTSQGSVTLAVETQVNGLAFSVTDTGVGLTADQMEWIHSAFAQVDGGVSRHNSGIGLGLPLARRLVGVLGGELTLNGKSNQGVTARFTVKASPVAARAAAT